MYGTLIYIRSAVSGHQRQRKMNLHIQSICLPCCKISISCSLFWPFVLFRVVGLLLGRPRIECLSSLDLNELFVHNIQRFV